MYGYGEHRHTRYIYILSFHSFLAAVRNYRSIVLATNLMIVDLNFI